MGETTKYVECVNCKKKFTIVNALIYAVARTVKSGTKKKKRRTKMSRDDLEHGWIVDERESEIEVAYTCGWCGEPIYCGDEYYDLCGDKVCEDCVRDCRRTA